MSSLSFYDQARQNYASTVPPLESGEFMIGGYVGNGGVDKRGEFKIVLHRFNHPSATALFGPRVPAALLTPQLRVFDDAYGALQEAIDAGLLDALETAVIKTRDDLTRLLIGLGFRDLSDKPLTEEAARMTTVYVDATPGQRPWEISRDARDPQGPAQTEIENLADTFARWRPGRVVRVYAVGRYLKPWRKQAKLDICYESKDGHATPDYRVVVDASPSASVPDQRPPRTP